MKTKKNHDEEEEVKENTKKGNENFYGQATISSVHVVQKNIK
jgi:hypothetical protein